MSAIAVPTAQAAANTPPAPPSPAAPQYFDVLQARAAYAAGRNVTELLRAQHGVAANTSAIIEIAYDLQAGSYIEAAERPDSHTRRYAPELAEVLAPHIGPQTTLLDVGSGELTTLSLLLRALPQPPAHTHAFDISWSRLHKGMAYARAQMPGGLARCTPFVADMAAIPLRDGAVELTISSHALEPNGGRLVALLAEIFRVTRCRVVLFEPGYEIACAEGRARMDRLGYIKGMADAVAALGGRVLDQVRIRAVSNRLNPTVGWIIEPPSRPRANAPSGSPDDAFAVPGSNHPLHRREGCFHSPATGLCFPVLVGIPVLKPGAAILATALDDEA